MKLNAGAAAWQKPTRSVPSRAARLALASAVALLAGQYLAGSFFLWSVHADVRSASPLTVARYGYYYGQHPVVRRRLWGSSVVGFTLVGATLPVWLPPGDGRSMAMPAARRGGRSPPPDS